MTYNKIRVLLSKLKLGKLSTPNATNLITPGVTLSDSSNDTFVTLPIVPNYDGVAQITAQITHNGIGTNSRTVITTGEEDISCLFPGDVATFTYVESTEENEDGKWVAVEKLNTYGIILEELKLLKDKLDDTRSVNSGTPLNW
jgi:hypothetical protein